ncbi:hypothetical protein HOM98_01605 [Candidatus Peregrinibacteria bacterium]|jgi:glucose uptake protein GlcU|nr:hypothetical protein [Candidatus Peregrinibacteria bacterium]MBT7483389.1 hypothetical protein [Candidatus Peregrinibacteria bacterium]
MFKKILSKTLFFLVLFSFLSATQAVHSKDIEMTNLDNGSSFNVGQILSTGDNVEEGGCTEGEVGSEGEQCQSYLKEDIPITAFILDIVNFVTRIVGAIAMILIIAGGLMMIVSQGEEHLLQKGKDVLTSAIFGLVIAMFSYIIVRFVQSLFYLPGV